MNDFIKFKMFGFFSFLNREKKEVRDCKAIPRLISFIEEWNYTLYSEKAETIPPDLYTKCTQLKINRIRKRVRIVCRC